jgi:hypothetical protein
VPTLVEEPKKKVTDQLMEMSKEELMKVLIKHLAKPDLEK